MKKMTQKQRVLRHLEEYGTIEPMVALREYGIYRLADVILQLRKSGYGIETKEIKTKNRFNEATRYAKYILTN